MSAIQDKSQQRSIIQFYGIYRLLLAAAICLSFLFNPLSAHTSTINHNIYILIAPGYLVFAIGICYSNFRFKQVQSDTAIFSELFVDVGAIMLLSYGAGNNELGLPLLLMASIAAGSLVLPGRLSLLVASMASLAALANAAAQILYGTASSKQFIVAGITGTAYFTTAIAIRYLRIRINTALTLAESRGSDIERLQGINEHIVQRMQTGIVIMAKDGQIKLMNTAAAELLHLPYKAAPKNLYAPQALISLVRKDNPLVSTLSLAQSQLDMHVTVTDLEQSPQQDKLLYIENLSKISQRAQNLKLASLGRFTASIAHEIRNPLGAISHAAQLLAESPELNSSDLRFANIIQNHTLRMNEVIKNVLELSRRRITTPERFRLDNFCQEFIREWPVSHNEVIDFKLLRDGNNFEVNVDRSQLRQIITNIVNNANQHARQPEQPLKIHFEILRPAQSEVSILDIIDNGPGISSEDLEKIFEPFFTTHGNGNGLGLYLCRELCLGNQMSIHYRRTASGDSCFRLKFPHPHRGTIPE